MAGGWAKDGAVQDQIDASIAEAVEHARSKLGQGPGGRYCEQCGEPIPMARRKALPGVRHCVECQTKQELEPNYRSGYNRRGSKDSQLR